MPAKSEAQQRLMGMALAAKRGKGHFSKKVHDMAKNMSEKQLHDFAATKHEGLPEKKAAIKRLLEKTAISGALARNTRPYFGPTSGPGVINMNPSAMGRLGRFFKPVARFIPGVTAGFGINDAVNASDRAAHGDTTGAWIDRISALGAAASLIPTPWTMGIGAGVSGLAGLINAYRDRKGPYGGVAQPQAAAPAPQYTGAGASGDWGSASQPIQQDLSQFGETAKATFNAAPNAAAQPIQPQVTPVAPQPISPQYTGGGVSGGWEPAPQVKTSEYKEALKALFRSRHGA